MTTQKSHFGSDNPFEVLGFTDKSQYAKLTDAELKTRHKKLLQQHHPDLQRTNAAGMAAGEGNEFLKQCNDNTAKINAAYDSLKDTTKRKTLASQHNSSVRSNPVSNSKPWPYNASSQNNPGTNRTTNSRTNHRQSSGFRQDYSKSDFGKEFGEEFGRYWNGKDFDFDRWAHDAKGNGFDGIRRATILERLKKANAQNVRPDLSDLYPGSTDLSGLDLKDAILSTKENRFISFNADFTNSVLKGAQFDHASLHNPIFKKSNIEGASFKNATLRNPSWGGTVKGVDFSNSNMPLETIRDVIFEDCNFSDMKTDYSEFHNVHFKNCRHNGVDYRTSKFSNVIFEGGEMKQTAFAREALEGIDLSKAEREGIKLSGWMRGSPKEALFNEQGEVTSRWQEFVKNEQWAGKKGLAFAAGAVALGAVAYGTWRMIERQRQQQEQHAPPSGRY